MKFLGKFIKILIYTIVVIIVLVNLIVVTTGRYYLYKTLANTIFKGRMGPSIEEYAIFNNRKVDIGTPKPWPMAKGYNKQAIPDSLLTQFKNMHTAAFVIIKNDSLTYEQYWDGHSDTSHTNSFSMGKSITSILCGMAIAEGKIKSVDEKVSDFIPQYKIGMDSLLTLQDLLEMGSGINFNENYISPFAYPAEAYYSSDIMKWTLKYKVDTIPGKRFIYESGNTTLIGYIISKATGKTLSEYASEKLWKPLGAEQPAFWSVDHEGGVEKAYCCFNSNARDFARIGELYLDSGRCNFQTEVVSNAFDSNWLDHVTYTQLIPKEWVVASTTPKLCAYYGYQWWILKFKGHTIPYCRGLLGQYIFVIPDQHMVVVRLGSKREIVSMQNIDGQVYNIPLDALVYLEAALDMYGK